MENSRHVLTIFDERTLLEELILEGRQRARGERVIATIYGRNKSKGGGTSEENPLARFKRDRNNRGIRHISLHAIFHVSI